MSEMLYLVGLLHLSCRKYACVWRTFTSHSQSLVIIFALTILVIYFYKKTNKMKTKLPLIALMLLTMAVYAQDLTFTFANVANTNDGTDDFYEADIFIQSSEDFKVGSGQIYFTYNPVAFGENIKASGNFEFLQPAGSITAQENVLPIYGPFIDNDNTTFRVSTAFLQALSSGSIVGNNVTSTPAHLFSIRIKYEDVSQSPDVAFETGAVFLDQTFTACGPAVFGFPDCTNEPGIQLFNDTFDSSGATLSIATFENNLASIKTFPNPVVNNFEIKGITTDINTAKIYNISGAVVKEISSEALNRPISVTDLSSGLYFLQLTSGNSQNTIKLFKQ